MRVSPMAEGHAEILHHGRNREALVAIATRPDQAPLCGFDTGLIEEVSAGFVTAYAVQTMLTPEDETLVSIRSVVDEIDSPLLGDERFQSYSPADVNAALRGCMHDPAASALRNPELLSWLERRGVTRGQVERYRMVDMRAVKDIDSRIFMGVEIHPALARWMGHSWPEGVVVPTTFEDGSPNGCHCRFLSTVPKVKFGASIPTMHVQTNLGAADEPECLFLVEGVFDGLAVERKADSLGWKFASPSSGFWTPEQVIILYRRIARLKGRTRIVMAHDMDRVGLKTDVVMGALFTALGFDVAFATWPDEWKDPAELAFKSGLDFASTVRFADPREVVEAYRALPYQRVVEYSSYLDNRHASYNNGNYDWVKGDGR